MTRGTNTQGNNYSSPGGTNSSGGSSYHYSNSNGSYYYAVPSRPSSAAPKLQHFCPTAIPETGASSPR